MIQQNIFFFLSFLAVLSALMVILAKNPIHSVLYLIITFFAIAGLYILLNAQFLAIVHIIVYAGAIMVLFLFVIMFLNLNADSEPQKSVWIKLAGVLSGGLFFTVLIAALKDAAQTTNPSPDTTIGLISNLGMVLFNEYLLPFEMVSVLFLTALIGAVILAKKEVGSEQ